MIMELRVEKGASLEALADQCGWDVGKLIEANGGTPSLFDTLLQPSSQKVRESSFDRVWKPNATLSSLSSAAAQQVRGRGSCEASRCTLCLLFAGRREVSRDTTLRFQHPLASDPAQLGQLLGLSKRAAAALADNSEGTEETSPWARAQTPSALGVPDGHTQVWQRLTPALLGYTLQHV